MEKSIIIIGAGLGGLSAGIYGQRNGFHTRIYEMGMHPGGQCASWQRSGYTFDCCIHHLMGCSPKSKLNRIWTEIGAMPAKMVYPKECVSAVSPNGKMFLDYYDPQKLEEELCGISPQDKAIIHEYAEAIRVFSKHDLMGDLMLSGIPGVLKNLPLLLRNMKWLKTSMKDFANRFSDPFLKQAFPLLVYSAPDMPMLMHLIRHACGMNGDIAWPEGASRAFIGGIEKKYITLGGSIHYGQRAVKILVKNNKAVGIRLEDGTEEFADYVISDADGRKTLLEMLDGKFMDNRLRSYCREPADETNWAVHVFLGVNRDLSEEPSSLIQLLSEPVTITGHELSSLEMQIYGFDPSMAPKGKGVIKAELVSSYSYWKKLAENRADYEAEKQKVTKQVVAILEKHFPGITNQIEVTDVPTLLTWEHFMGGTHGFCNGPSKNFGLGSFLHTSGNTVPGLENFYFAGVWATSMGATFMNALSGKKAVEAICKKEKIKFQVRAGT